MEAPKTPGKNLNEKIVLVGGGHANVLVMKHLASLKMKNKHFLLISDYPKAYYSGMLPGCIAKLYRPEQLQIDLVPLSAWCGFHFLHAKVVKVDPDEQLIFCVDMKGEKVKYIPKGSIKTKKL